jgi:hypothetical protein
MGECLEAALVVRGHRHAQGSADRLNPEAATVLVDVAAHFGRSGSSSLAKNTLADFTISFARRSSKFSWRSRLISSRSSLVGKIRPQALVGFRLPHPLTQRLGMDPKITSDLRDRTAALERQPHATREQLLGLLPRSRHDSGESLLPRTASWNRGPRETRSGSGRLTRRSDRRAKASRPQSAPTECRSVPADAKVARHQGLESRVHERRGRDFHWRRWRAPRS